MQSLFRCCRFEHKNTIYSRQQGHTRCKSLVEKHAKQRRILERVERLFEEITISGDVVKWRCGEIKMTPVACSQKRDTAICIWQDDWFVVFSTVWSVVCKGQGQHLVKTTYHKKNHIVTAIRL